MKNKYISTEISRFLNRGGNVNIHSQYFAELSTTSTFSIQNIKLCLPMSYATLHLQYLTAYLISVGKYLRGNPDFLVENTAN